MSVLIGFSNQMTTPRRLDNTMTGNNIDVFICM